MKIYILIAGLLIAGAGCYSVPPEIMAVKVAQDNGLTVLSEDIGKLSDASIVDQRRMWEDYVKREAASKLAAGAAPQDVVLWAIDEIKEQEQAAGEIRGKYASLQAGIERLKEMNKIMGKYLELTDNRAAQAAAMLRALNEILGEQ